MPFEPWSWVPESWKTTPDSYFGGTDEVPPIAPPLPPAPPPATVDEQLAFKQAQYEREGMAPDQIAKAQEFNRPKYEETYRQQTKPPPGSPPELVDAWLAKSPGKVAHIAQATGPTGTIGQIGHEGLGGQQQEAPLGWEGLSPVEESQIEIDGLKTPPPLGEVDAISGGYTPEQVDRASGRGTTTAQPGKTPDEYLSGDELGVDMSKRSPEEQAMFLAKIEQSRDNFAASRALEESNKAAQAAHDNARIRNEAIRKTQERRASLEVEAKKIADTDPATTIPGYKKLFGVLAAFVGGFAANKTGRNMGLEVVDSIANDAAQQQAQKLGLVQKQIAGVGEDAAAAEDTYHVSEAVRLATYDTALKTLQSEVQLYDPRGSQAARIMGAMQEIQGRRADAAAKYEQQTFENSMKAGDLAIKARQQGLAETKFLTEEQRKAAAAALGAGVKQSPEFWEAYSTQPGVPGRRPPMDMTEKEYKAWLSTAGTIKSLNKGPGDKSEAQLRKEEAEATKAEAEAGAAESGFAIASPETGEALKQKDGKPFVVMDTTERSRLRGITAAAVNIRRLADKIEEVRKKTGGGSKLLGTDDAQELQSLAKAVDFETYKAFDLGAPSAGDQEMAQGIKGGVDVTSFLKDPKKGLQTYADSVEKKALTHLRGANYTGPALHFRRASELTKAAPTVIDEIGQKLAKTAYAPSTKSEGPSPYDLGKQTREAIYAPTNKSATEMLSQLEAYASVQNDTGDQAREMLRALAAGESGAVYPAVQARAKEILSSLPGTNVRGDAAR